MNMNEREWDLISLLCLLGALLAVARAARLEKKFNLINYLINEFKIIHLGVKMAQQDMEWDNPLVPGAHHTERRDRLWRQSWALEVFFIF